jgi:hypothetical protein
MTRGRWAGKPDANQAEIVAALRQAGAQVLIISGAGHDAPDLLVGWRDVDGHERVVLMEVKNPLAHGRLRPGQARWLADWPGDTAVVSSPEEALAAMGCALA